MRLLMGGKRESRQTTKRASDDGNGVRSDELRITNWPVQSDEHVEPVSVIDHTQTQVAFFSISLEKL